MGSGRVSYSVIRIRDHKGAVRFEAIRSVDLRQREQDVQTEYLKAARQRGVESGSSSSPLQKPEVRVWRVIMGWPDAPQRAEAAAKQFQKSESLFAKGGTNPQPDGEPTVDAPPEAQDKTRSDGPELGNNAGPATKLPASVCPEAEVKTSSGRREAGDPTGPASKLPASLRPIQPATPPKAPASADPSAK